MTTSEEPQEETSSPSSGIPGLEIRLTEESDLEHLRSWLEEPEVLRWFPMHEEREIEDSVKRWIGFHKYKCSLTAVLDGVPCGICTLYLQPYVKLMHQCEFGIIVKHECRGKGIGSLLLNSAMHLAKTRFKIELIHLQVYADNPAMRLYERFGFEEFGRQDAWIKEEEGKYLGRVFMQRYL